jgi:polysaccharide biosynthesis protein PslH
MRILFLSRWYPYPPNNGSKLRIYNLLKGLAQHHAITLISFFDATEGTPDLTGLETYCERIHTVAYKGFEPGSPVARLGLFSTTPRSVLDTYSVEVEALIKQALDRDPYDVVIASQFDMAIYAQTFSDLPAIFEEIESGIYLDRAVQARSIRKRLRHGLTWFKHRRYLARLLRAFRACTVVSEQERRILRQIAPRGMHIEVVPNCVDLESYAHYHGKPEFGTMIFTGSFNFAPNYDAMLWFLAHVYPVVQSRIPSASLIITGEHGGKPLPPARNIALTGYVDDVRPYVANAWLSLAPIHQGGGTRVKILEAMALRTPVIATSKGAEGLDVQHGVHIYLADEPAAFADAVVEVLEDQTLRDQLAGSAFQLVRQRYNWANVIPGFERLMERITTQDKQQS